MTDPPTQSPGKVPSKPRPFRFRIVHIIYVVTLLACSLATFGPGGLLPGTLTCVFWAYVFTRQSRPAALVWAIALAVVGGCLISGLLLPAVQTAREAARRMVCANNLKHIGLALHNYHADYGSFPPAYLADESGHPMHSWRVLLLPYLEQQRLYDMYDFKEPWDGPNNIQLLSDLPWIYSCPGVGPRDNQTCTSYVAVVGPQTAWPGSSAISLADISDGASNTVLVVESSNQTIPWLAPQDPDFTEALKLLDSNAPEVAGSHQSEDFFYRYYTGRNVLFADGSVRFVSNGVGHSVWSALLGVDDAVAWSEEVLGTPSAPAKRLKVGNCVRLGIFVLLSLLPLPWVWLNPTSGLPPSPPTAIESRLGSGDE